MSTLGTSELNIIPTSQSFYHLLGSFLRGSLKSLSPPAVMIDLHTRAFVVLLAERIARQKRFSMGNPAHEGLPVRRHRGY